MIPPDAELPEGIARRKARAVLDGLDAIDGLEITEVEIRKRLWVVDFHLPDRSVLPSSLALNRETGNLVELTLRFGSVGDHPVMTNSEKRDIEGEVVDLLLDAEERSAVDGIVKSYRVDLGDAWAFESARPHFRLSNHPGGYDIAPKEVVSFIEEASDIWLDRFGRLEDRRFAEAFEDNFIDSA